MASLRRFAAGAVQVFHAGVGRVLATDPSEAEVEQHFLQIFAAGEAVGEAAGRAEAVGFDADALLQRDVGQADVLAQHVGDRSAADQPRGALKAVLNFSGRLRQQVDVIVRVIADRVAFARQSL